MTGDEYIESLRDGREIWLHGERVKDVTTHPAFRNPIRMTARLYDSMHTGDYVDEADQPDRHRKRRSHHAVLQGTHLLGGPAQGA